MQMDEVLSGMAELVKNYAVIYLIDITEVRFGAALCPMALRGEANTCFCLVPPQVPDFNTMYELYDACTIMFFFRNKHIMIDLGTGNNNKINWAFSDKQEFIDIVETVYRGAKKGRGLVVSPRDYSTKYRY